MTLCFRLFMDVAKKDPKLSAKKIQYDRRADQGSPRSKSKFGIVVFLSSTKYITEKLNTDLKKNGSKGNAGWQQQQSMVQQEGNQNEKSGATRDRFSCKVCLEIGFLSKLPPRDKSENYEPNSNKGCPNLPEFPWFICWNFPKFCAHGQNHISRHTVQ